jgi:branched-subunit amino acid transport protein
MSTAWLMVGLLAVGAFALKAAGPVVLGDRELPPQAGAVIARLAPSLLTALIVVDVFGTPDRTLAIDETAGGLLAAAAALAARLPMIVAVILAAVVTAGLRAL